MASFGFIETYYRLNKKEYKIILVLVALLCLSITALDLKKLHPYEYIYFNKIGGGVRLANGKFPVDYWGASFKEASDWVLKDSENSEYETFVMTCNSTAAVEYYGRSKFEVTNEKQKANYIICQDTVKDLEPTYEVKRNNVVLNSIYKVN